MYFPKIFLCMVHYILWVWWQKIAKKKGQKQSSFEAVGKIVHYDHLKVDKNYRQVLKFKSFCSVSEKLKTFFSSFGA